MALGSVRVRTTLAATAVVALALALAGVALVHVLRVSLQQNREGVAATQAADIAALASSGRLLPTLASPNEDATLSQVIDPGNQVLAASANVIGEPAVAPFAPLGDRHAVRQVKHLPVSEGGPALVYLLGGHLGGRPVTILTVVSLDATEQAVQTVVVGLVIGLPLLLAVVGAMAWVIIGRALRPIDAIRAEVSEITNHDLHRRVPEPAVADEVGRLARTMNSMLERLEASSQRQRRFVADASHELRSPLSAIRTQLEVGVARGDATDWPTTAQEVLVDEARMERLVTNLLVLARLEVGGEGPAGETVDLGDVVRHDLAARVERRGVALRAEVASPARAAIGPEAARQIVTNLVDNAQRHARHHVVITVRTDDRVGVTLVVDDDGPGVDPSEREVIFERFARLDHARSPSDGGAGLGLAIVRDVVVRHGGSVAFTDGATGARVVVVLPALSSPPPT